MTERPTGEEAIAWLKAHPDSRVHLTLRAPEEPDAEAYSRLLEILFSPDMGDHAA